MSGVSTPSGNLGNKSKKSESEITCPKCGSSNVNIRDDDTAHCSDCNYDWSLSDDGEVKESFDPFKGLKTVKDPNPSGSLPDGYVTDGLGNVYRVPDKGYSKDYKYKGYTFRYNYKSKEVEMLNKGNVVNSLGLSSGNWFDGPDYWVGKMYSSSIHEGIDEGYYKVGKRYRTSDNMYFVVKKINKDGTIKVYDEDLGKSYDAEVSDLELLDPVMVKEGIVDKYYDFEVRDILQKLDNYIKTMKTNIKSIESKLKKGNTSCLSVKGTLDMCKNVDKISDTFGLYDYYSKDLKGVSDDDTERLMDVWYQSLDEIERKKRDIMYNKA